MSVALGYQPRGLAGTVLEQTAEGIAPIGSCFALRRADRATTAAHVLGEMAEGSRVLVAWGNAAPALAVVASTMHPRADLAVLQLEPDPLPSPVAPFLSIGQWPAERGTVGVFGWSWDLAPGPGPASALITGPLFGFADLPQPDAYQYAGAELGAVPPDGFSGGPVFRPEDPRHPIGVYTSRLTARRVRHEPIVRPNGETVELPIAENAAPSTGFALRLDVYADWLHEQIGPPTRAANSAAGGRT
jgi:hypothetical protein